jgi:hypothetical protein
MGLFIDLLGLLGLISITLLGIGGSGWLAARRMRQNELEPSTAPTERNHES